MSRPYAVYTVRENPKDKDKPFWVRIGAAFRHKNGTGLNVVLDAMPLDGKFVIIPQKDKEEAPPAGDA